MGAELKSAKGRFVESWGQMGGAWGINKTMARMHALLMISETPLTMDDVMRELARGETCWTAPCSATFGTPSELNAPDAESTHAKSSLTRR